MFETVILVLIVASSIKLALDTYLYDTPSTSLVKQISSYLDYFFTVSFALESIIKAISLGFVLD